MIGAAIQFDNFNRPLVVGSGFGVTGCVTEDLRKIKKRVDEPNVVGREGLLAQGERLARFGDSQCVLPSERMLARLGTKLSGALERVLGRRASRTQKNRTENQQPGKILGFHVASFIIKLIARLSNKIILRRRDGPARRLA